MLFLHWFIYQTSRSIKVHQVYPKKGCLWLYLTLMLYIYPSFLISTLPEPLCLVLSPLVEFWHAPFSQHVSTCTIPWLSRPAAQYSFSIGSMCASSAHRHWTAGAAAGQTRAGGGGTAQGARHEVPLWVWGPIGWQHPGILKHWCQQDATCHWGGCRNVTPCAFGWMCMVLGFFPPLI